MERITYARYGLLMEGESLEIQTAGDGYCEPGYFMGTLFEGRQDRPLPIGVVHYPVALTEPPKYRVRCELCRYLVQDADAFWQRLYQSEMIYPHLSPEFSLMQVRHTTVFTLDGAATAAPLFVLNPLFYLFWRERYDMRLTEIAPDAEGFVGWRAVPPWKPDEDIAPVERC